MWLGLARRELERADFASYLFDRLRGDLTAEPSAERDWRWPARWWGSLCLLEERPAVSHVGGCPVVLDPLHPTFYASLRWV